MPSRWKCLKCGETASSKCVNSHSIFPSNQNAVMLANMLRLKMNHIRDGETITGRQASEYELVISYRMIFTEDEPVPSPQEATQTLMEIFKKTNDATLKIALCHHDWKILSGECLYGCHKAALEVEA